MELIDRYVEAIRFWMPFSKNRDDILNELRDELQSQLDEKRESLGRALTEDDISEVLKRFGHPFAVAGRFLPNEILIGNALFPIYAQVLRLMLWIVGMGLLFSTVVVVTTSGRPITGIFQNISKFGQFAVYAFGLITLIFVVLERKGVKGLQLSDWNPRQLPALQDAWHIPRTKSIAELVFNFCFLAVWTAPSLLDPVLASLAQNGWTPGPAWAAFHDSCFLIILAMAVVKVVLAALAIVEPTWTRARLLLRAVMYIGVGAALLHYSWPYLPELPDMLRQLHVPKHDHRQLTSLLNDVALQIAIPASAAICLFAAAADLWRAFWGATPFTGAATARAR